MCVGLLLKVFGALLDFAVLTVSCCIQEKSVVCSLSMQRSSFRRGGMLTFPPLSWNHLILRSLPRRSGMLPFGRCAPAAVPWNEPSIQQWKDGVHLVSGRCETLRLVRCAVRRLGSLVSGLRSNLHGWLRRGRPHPAFRICAPLGLCLLILRLFFWFCDKLPRNISNAPSSTFRNMPIAGVPPLRMLCFVLLGTALVFACCSNNVEKITRLSYREMLLFP